NAFLEDEEDLAARGDAQLAFLLDSRCIETKCDVRSLQNFACELSHPLGQVAYAVAPRVGSPDDIAHRIHQLPRYLRNLIELAVRPGSSGGKSTPGELAQNGDMREARPDVVV